MNLTIVWDTFTKILDICFVWIAFYYILKNVKNNIKMVLIVKGVIIILLVKLLSNWLNLYTVGVILEYAMNNNFTYVVDGKRHDRVDEITAIIQKAEKYINDNEYDKVVSLLKSESDVIGNSVYYYQKNKLVDDMTDGKALILQKNGVYTGEIKNDKKNGQGKQLGIYSDDYSYTVSDGSWKNGKLNGEAIYYEPNIAVSSSKSEDKVDFTYKGNFTENYYDGVISATWESESGIYEAKFTADMGNITVLREENGKYIYLDDGKGYYWYFEDPTALQGWIVWAGQDSK